MQRILTALLLMSPGLLMAQDESMAVLDAKKKADDVSAISLLPPNSVLDGVMLPRYDKDRQIVDVLKAKRMKIEDADRISGETVTIEFFNPDRTSKGRVDMVSAIFNQRTGILRAKEPVDVRSDRVLAHGTGLYYSMQDGKGFLLGPATTRILNPPATAMNIPSPLRATALLGASMLPLLAAVPPVEAPSAAETESSAPAVEAANKETRENLSADLERSAEATKEASKFLKDAELLSSQPVTLPPVPEPKVFEVKTGPDDTIVNCEGGMYFDSEAGVLVYLRNVKVVDPRFDLSGANEVKVFFKKKPVDETKKADASKQPAEGKAPAQAPAKPADKISGQAPKGKPALNMGGGAGGGFGDVDKIVATGPVRVLQKSTEPGKPPVEASGAVFTYNVKTGEIIISGGYPWVKQGTYYSRAKRPNETLHVFSSGTFSTEGFWEMGGPLNQKK